jgi:hypothetical protein
MTSESSFEEKMVSIMTNLPATLSTLQNEISVITEKLAPCGSEEVGRCLASLMDAGMMIPASIQAEDKVEEYRIALKGVPLHGLRTVFVKLKRGEYDIENRSFIPLPAEMAAMSHAECRSLRDDRARANERLRTIADNRKMQPRAPTPLLKDLRVTQRLRADDLQGQGYAFLCECKGHDAFASMAKKRQIPAGAIHLWAIDEVWAPKRAVVSRPAPLQAEKQEAA